MYVIGATEFTVNYAMEGMQDKKANSKPSGRVVSPGHVHHAQKED